MIKQSKQQINSLLTTLIFYVNPSITFNRHIFLLHGQGAEMVKFFYTHIINCLIFYSSLLVEIKFTVLWIDKNVPIFVSVVVLLGTITRITKHLGEKNGRVVILNYLLPKLQRPLWSLASSSIHLHHICQIPLQFIVFSMLFSLLPHCEYSTSWVFF